MIETNSQGMTWDEWYAAASGGRAIYTDADLWRQLKAAWKAGEDTAPWLALLLREDAHRRNRMRQYGWTPENQGWGLDRGLGNGW